MFCQTYERLFQKLLTRDDQANLQPTLNKEVRVSQFLSLILENSLRSQVLRINYVINYFHHSKKKKKKKKKNNYWLAENQETNQFENTYIFSYGEATNIRFEEQLPFPKRIPWGTPLHDVVTSLPITWIRQTFISPVTEGIQLSNLNRTCMTLKGVNWVLL